MFRRLSIRIADQLISMGRFMEEDRAIYQFGLEMLFLNLVNLLSAAFIGLFMGQLLECFLFLALFIPLRCHAGGYHAENPLCCYFLSNAVIVFVLLLLRTPPVMMERGAGVAFLTLSAGMAAILAPVENLNKPLDEVEKRVYGFRTRIVLIIEVLIGLVCYAYAYDQGGWIVLLTIALMVITELLGILQNTFSRSR
ncbi:accessory gene regulator ArgB-like protein [Lacrimispora aerotolerans]|uniref:accessory gene regulator ArgB-like protein n=1 Tax=Lacrimispora aerotolerans TaxID=36832 RepID=UPI0009FD2D80|nr:accessory gene regulator B family protein [Lacrimispora aerotolerans]